MVTSIINRNESKRAGSVTGKRREKRPARRDEKGIERFHLIRAVTREYKPLETADNEETTDFETVKRTENRFGRAGTGAFGFHRMR